MKTQGNALPRGKKIHINLVAKVCSPAPVFGDDESIANSDFRALSFNLDTNRKKTTSIIYYNFLGRGQDISSLKMKGYEVYGRREKLKKRMEVRFQRREELEEIR